MLPCKHCNWTILHKPVNKESRIEKYVVIFTPNASSNHKMSKHLIWKERVGSMCEGGWGKLYLVAWENVWNSLSSGLPKLSGPLMNLVPSPLRCSGESFDVSLLNLCLKAALSVSHWNPEAFLFCFFWWMDDLGVQDLHLAPSGSHETISAPLNFVSHPHLFLLVLC